MEQHFLGANYQIRILNPGGNQKGAIEITLDGKRFAGSVLPVFEYGKTHKVEVRFFAQEGMNS